METRLWPLALAAACLMCSCASIVPKEDVKGVGLVMILSECNLTSDEVFVAYDLVYDDGKTIRIDPSKKFTVIDNLPIGTHTMKGVRLFNRMNTDDQLQEYPLEGSFSVGEKKVYLMPFKFLVVGKDTANGKGIFTGMEKLTGMDVVDAKTFFYKHKYTDGWKMIY